MAKFYALGNYTAQGFQGFIKDPKTDRSKAAQVAAEAVGAKLVSYTGLRGAYDFLNFSYILKFSILSCDFNN